MQLKPDWSSWGAGKGLILLNKALGGQMPQQAALPGHVLPGGKMLPMPTGEATSPVLASRQHLRGPMHCLCSQETRQQCTQRSLQAWFELGLAHPHSVPQFPHELWLWCHRYCSHGARGHTESWVVSPEVYPTNSAVQEMPLPRCPAGRKQHFHLQAAN